MTNTIRPPRTIAIDADGTPVSRSEPATSVSISALSAGVSDCAMAGKGSASAASVNRRNSMATSKQKAGVGATPQLNVELAEQLNPY
ncbi:hypothetical protein SPHINGOT1_10222 [Sphingomonas sp. T1]|nr:hypothetical protein SPHINGOT1_10222 [Sphingomonas sp. T1]